MRKMESYAGTTIDSAIAKAIAEAQEHSDQVEFDFNGVTVQVAGDSDAALILRDWWRGMLRPSGTFTVTAYPPTELSAEQLSEDARLKAEQEERSRKSQEEYQRRQAIKTAALDGALSVAPALALKDEAKWQEYVSVNKDGGYGEACVRYAEKWGRLMQARMLPLINLELSPEMISVNVTKFLVKEADERRVADDEGITGFMYGAAVSMLAQCWVYGEELRRWHNLKTQLRHEGEAANASGGVLNPALLTIG